VKHISEEKLRKFIFGHIRNSCVRSCLDMT
jgi:hypothetical protein